MKAKLPISLKIAAGLSAIACASLVIFLIAGQIYSYSGWRVSWWPDLVFEGLTAVSWFSAFGAAIMTLVGTWATRRYLSRLEDKFQADSANSN